MKFSAQASEMSDILHPLTFHGVAETHQESVSVDVPEDVARIERLLGNSRSA